MAAELLRLEETESTNLWLRTHGGSEDKVVWADYQTAGRGCGSNTWESERGQNLTFSVLYHPRHIAAKNQFFISMATAVAIREVLDKYGEGFTIKWPNDIYYQDRKISGMLIENQLQGENIKDCIIGIGLNVNQVLFVSNAPNPVSLKHITGHDMDREQLLSQLVNQIFTCLEYAEYEDMHSKIYNQYHKSLYRLGGTYRFRFPDGTMRDCLVEGVDRLGRLHLSWTEKNYRGEWSDTLVNQTFGFKEVEFMI